MYNYLVPLLRKQPDKIILHVGTNDARHIKTDEMKEKSGKLKSLIWEMLPSVKIILSASTIMRQKALKFLGKLDSSEKETFGFKLSKRPPFVDKLAGFESDLLMMIHNIELKQVRINLLPKLKLM